MIHASRLLHRNLKSVFAVFVGIIVFTFSLIEIRSFMSAVPDMLQMIDFKFSKVDERMKHLEYMELERNKLLKRLSLLLNVTDDDLPARRELLWAESAQLYEVLADKNSSAPTYSMHFDLPSIYIHLPHIHDHRLLTPILALRNEQRKAAYLTIGIPTVPRQNRSYLIGTLQSLIDSLEPEEKEMVVIVVLVAEIGYTDMARETVRGIQVKFTEMIDDGLLEVIVPQEGYYPPDLNTMAGSYNDSPERTRWRTKQNLDYLYLMSYCRSRSLYYMQLEDDVVTKMNFFSNIKFFIEKNSMVDWFMLEFSTLGFIGKLFKCRSLPILIHFIALFHRDKPVDWLLFRLLHVRFCALDLSPKQCQKAINKKVLPFMTKLFQHVGVESSLKGKIQKLKEKDFSGELKSLIKPHLNPSCKLNTSLVTYKKHTLQDAYGGSGHFWAMTPVKGDHITFAFDHPVVVTGFMFKSGSPDHPNDLLNNTSAQIKSLFSLQDYLDYKSTYDGYLIVASNDPVGVINVNFPFEVIVTHLRITFLRNCTNWLLLSEIWIRHLENIETTP